MGFAAAVLCLPKNFCCFLVRQPRRLLFLRLGPAFFRANYKQFQIPRIKGDLVEARCNSRFLVSERRQGLLSSHVRLTFLQDAAPQAHRNNCCPSTVIFSSAPLEVHEAPVHPEASCKQTTTSLEATWWVQSWLSCGIRAVKQSPLQTRSG